MHWPFFVRCLHRFRRSLPSSRHAGPLLSPSLSTTSHLTPAFPLFFCVTFSRVDGQRAAHGSCSATQRATTALVVAIRAAVDRHGPRRSPPPQRWTVEGEGDGEAREAGGGGARDARCRTGTSGDASGSPDGARAADEAARVSEVGALPTLGLPVLSGASGEAMDAPSPRGHGATVPGEGAREGVVPDGQGGGRGRRGRHPKFLPHGVRIRRCGPMSLCSCWCSSSSPSRTRSWRRPNLRSPTDSRTSSYDTETGMHCANCAAYVGIPLVQHLVWLLTRPLLRNDRCHGGPFIPAYMANKGVAAPVVDIGSGIFMAGIAGILQFALCSLLLSSGSRCSVSRSVWTRRTAVQRDCGRSSSSTVAFTGLVLLVTLHLRCVPFVSRQAHGLRPFGRRVCGRARRRQRWHEHGTLQFALCSL